MPLFPLLSHIGFVVFLALGSWLVTKAVLRINILDIPNERSSHSTPIPRGGGLGIVIVFFVGVMMIFFVADQTKIHQQYFWSFLISTMLIAMISMYDDIKGYSFKVKLATQVIAVCLVMITGTVLDYIALPWVGGIDLGIWGLCITAFWLLGLTNAYNFMDGVDGMAVTTALVASVAFAWITFQAGSHFVYLVSLVVVAGVLGFLPWNFPKARIFMGDIGSTFLGFTFACMAIIAARYDISHTSFLVIPLLLFHFVFDTSFTLTRRLFSGEKVTDAHRTHIYQLIQQMGFSHVQVTSIYMLLAVAQAGAAMYMMRELAGGYRWLIFLPFFAIYLVTSMLIVKRAKQKGIL